MQRNFEDQILYISSLVDYSTTSRVKQTNENKSRGLRKVMLLSHVDIHEKNWLDWGLNDQKQLQYVLTQQSVIPTWPLGRQPD